jgi:hypothetical protein
LLPTLKRLIHMIVAVFAETARGILAVRAVTVVPTAVAATAESDATLREVPAG